MSSSLSEELEYSQAVVRPLLAALQAVVALVPSTLSTPPSLILALQNAQMAASTFYSLNSPGLTDAFEETLPGWMAAFHALLVLDAPAAAEPDPEKEGALDGLKATICKCLSLFLERNEEEFAQYLQQFVQAAWTQLVAVSPNPGQDRLALQAINFLAAVARSVHSSLFQDQGALQQICESIVVPNVRMRDDLEELFDLNWLEYVRRDTEGSDSDTRRRAAFELVKALTERFPQEVTRLFAGYVAALFQEAAGAAGAQVPPRPCPARDECWRAKDCALYLVTALAVRGKTAAQGAVSVNELVDLQDVFARQVLPELESADVEANPVVKADALKFATTFRSQIPKPAALALFPCLVRLLGSSSNVVHSYAAIAAERFLAMKEPGQPGKLRFAPQDLAEHLSPLLDRLFAAFALPDSAENEYCARAIMRVVGFVGATIAPVAALSLEKLAALLLAVCRNPTAPGFSHYVFESVAALVRFGHSADAGALSAYEAKLFPAFQVVLAEDVQEFHPYVFQIFAQLLELRPEGEALPPAYLAIFPPLLSPTFWERPGNVPPLARLVRACLARGAPQLAQQGHLPGVLGVFQKLVASRAHDHEGFAILQTLCGVRRGLDEALAPFWGQIWQLLFARLQSSKTPKFCKGLCVCVSHFVVRKGASALFESVEKVQPGITLMLLRQVWVPALPTVAGSFDKKVAAAAAVRLLTELPALQAPEAADVWAAALGGLIALVEGGGATAAEGHADEDADEETSGYAVSFARLHNAQVPEPDPLPEVADCRRFAAQQLAAFSAKSPGTVAALTHGRLEGERQAQLGAWCAAAQVSIA